MKVKGRIYTPTGRQFEMIEMVYEGDDEDREAIQEVILKDAKDLYHCLKDVEAKDGSGFFIDGVMWRRKDNMWSYYDTDKKAWFVEDQYMKPKGGK